MSCVASFVVTGHAFHSLAVSRTLCYLFATTPNSRLYIPLKSAVNLGEQPLRQV